MTEKHMIFFQHGLHGTFADYDVMIKNFKERYPDLLLVSGSANGGVKTREGIDKCGERMAHEVTEVSKLLKPTKISIVGHSLGGPISRYAIGILYEQGYFNNVSPIQYISLSSPHCGSRRPQKGAFNVTVSFFTDKC
ncbi:esterase/lipase/thioesterase domain-containing protein [Heterostelium album PN500]|uniref:Esterase/lipase/thioesterase domain-containing protein n=1 Tax=Heterostelium pallidum (strain ATCC 26659 / Pp 5 / PN500) TaxID=670386 RepID=D3AZN5_HETP5|nr:esterase/lipase/thioesterase domain-containing protein [Heterostelium album PN500]EFA85414.1 esterase/lipase/thioesterase domain-containing protein [Heterostelium album PN500]|eukprot:XP_020437523.1 esterase/lipase/thioesterase domain-containing protein [Heterostelium album PN500]